MKFDKHFHKNGMFCHFAAFLRHLACHVFQPINLHFVVGHPRNISTKLYLNLTNQFRGEEFSAFLMTQQPKLSIEFKSLNNFEKGLPKKHSCEVWLKLVQWFRRCLLKLKVNDNNAQQTKSDQNWSPWAFGGFKNKW